MSIRTSLLVGGFLALSGAAAAQSGPVTNPPNPPAPPRTDAPGSPINPRQTAATGVTAPANQAPAAVDATPQSAPLRELNFAEADADGDKKVTLTEFSNYVGNRSANHSVEPVTEEVIERFQRLDQNGDGALTESEANTPPAPVSMQPQSTMPPRRN